MKFTKFLGLSVKKLDLFAEAVSLTFKESNKIPTKSGVFFSLLLVFIVFAVSNSTLESIIYRSTVYIQNFPSVTDNPPEVSLKNRFAFYFSATELAVIKGKRYFDFSIDLGSINFFEDGSFNRTYEDIKLVKCNESHFPMLNEAELKRAGINDWVCPDYHDEKANFSVKGTFGNPEYKYIRINVKSCSNATNKENESYCGSEEELKAKIKSFSKIYFDLVVINNIIDLNDLKNPYKPSVEFIAFIIEPNKTFTQKEVYFQNTTISTDLTQSFNAFRSEPEYQQEKSPVFQGRVENFLITDISSARGAIATTVLRSDKVSQKYVRKYNCVQDYLQNLGSFYTIFFLIFSFMNSYLSKPFRTNELADSLYYFKDYEKEDSRNQIKRKTLSYFAQRFKELGYLLFGRAKIHGYPYQKIQKHLIHDLDVSKILLSLKSLNNFKQTLVNQKPRIVLDLTENEEFDKFPLKNFKKKKKKKLKSIQRLSSLNFQVARTDAKEFIFEKIDYTFENLRKESKNETSILIRKNKYQKNDFGILSLKIDQSTKTLPSSRISSPPILIHSPKLNFVSLSSPY